MGNVYIFGRKIIQETVHQISTESPEFYRRYYRKHFGLFFPDTLYYFNALFQQDCLSMEGRLHESRIHSYYCDVDLEPITGTLTYV